MTERKRYSRDEIYTAFHDKVLGYIRPKVRSNEDAEDLCSEVFLKVYTNLERYDDRKAGISTWIYSITRNAVIDYYRTTRIFEELPEDLVDEESPEESALNRVLLRRLADGLSLLTSQQCDIIVLHYYQGLTLRKISDLMKLSYGVTKLRHNEALAKLRRLLG